MTTNVRVLVVSAAAEERPGRPEHHHLRLVARLAGTPGLVVTPVTWYASPLEADLAEVATPAGPARTARRAHLRALRRVAPGLAARVKDRWTGAWLVRHRRTPVLLHGAACATVLPWLRHHRAPVVWLVLDGEIPVPPVDPRAPEQLHLLVETADAAAGVVRVGHLPPAEVVGLVEPLGPVSVPEAAGAVVGVLGRLEADHGVDLLPRLVWAMARRVGAAPPVQWAVDGALTIPAPVHHDLRQLGLSVTFEPAPRDLDRWLDDVAVVALPWRAPAPAALLERVARAGRPVVRFAASSPAAPTSDTPGDDVVPFPEIEELADVVLAWRGDPSRRDRLAAERPPEQVLRRLISLISSPGPSYHPP